MVMYQFIIFTIVFAFFAHQIIWRNHYIDDMQDNIDNRIKYLEKLANSEKPEEFTEESWKSYKAGLVYSVNTMKDYMNPFIDETDKEDS